MIANAVPRLPKRAVAPLNARNPHDTAVGEGVQGPRGACHCDSPRARPRPSLPFWQFV